MSFYFEPLSTFGPQLFERLFMQDPFRSHPYHSAYNNYFYPNNGYGYYPCHEEQEEDEDEMYNDHEDRVCYQPQRYTSRRNRRSPKKQCQKREIPVTTSSHASEVDSQAKVNLKARENAAKIIQRVYKAHLKEKKERAAMIIAKFLQDSLACRKVKEEILPSLKKVKQIEADLSNLYQLYITNRRIFSRRLLFENGRIKFGVGKNIQFLEYEDLLIKLMLKADQIESFGHEEVRTRRKSLISSIQNCLNECDGFKQEQSLLAQEEEDDLTDVFNNMYN